MKNLDLWPRTAIGISITFILVLLLAGANFIAYAQQEVDIEASIEGRLVFEIADGESVELAADPMDNPQVEGETVFTVRTNVSSYSINANFGAFEVGGTGYDLIDNENFMIQSTAPGDGSEIPSWTVPSGEMTILGGEAGMTDGEDITVRYQLNVDFTVPSGTGSTTITFTTTPSL